MPGTSGGFRFFRSFLVPLSFLLFLDSATKADALLRSPNEREIEVIPNPHRLNVNEENHYVCGMANHNNLDQFLEPYHLLTKPLTTQSDTFQEISYAKVMDYPVPIYHMKQPERLSAAEFEFQLVLVKELSVSSKMWNIQTVSVDMDSAKDSWFPGYYWNPIVLDCSVGGVPGPFEHVGWKFTALDDDKAASTELTTFYALMVQIKAQKQEGVKVLLGGFQAPKWMGAAILS